MKKVTMYKAFDDMIFDTEQECHEYEHDVCNELIDTIRKIKEICKGHGKNCDDCIFFTGRQCIMAQMIGRNTECGYTPNLWNCTFDLD